MAKVIIPDYPRFIDYPDFLPDLSPAAMLAAGVFDGGYFFKGIEEDLKGISSSILSAGPYKEKPNPKFNHFKTSSGQSLSIWRKNGWIHDQDPLGWFHFYCRFYSGRRSEDDKRQITRWVDYKRRWTPKSTEAAKRQAITPKGRQALLHWGIDPFLLLKTYRKH